jgi:hypothetical protein
MKHNENSRESQKHMMADWAMVVSLPSIEHPLEQYEVAAGRTKFEEDFQFLLGKGCDALALETALCMAKTIRARVMPKAETVRSAADKMRALAGEISELESSYFLVAQESEEINRGTGIPLTLHNVIALPKDAVLERQFPHFFLPELLSRRAEMYDE